MKTFYINIIQTHIILDRDTAKAGLDPIGKDIEAVRAKVFGWAKHAVPVCEMVKECRGTAEIDIVSTGKI